MKCLALAAGMLLVLSSVWLRAVRKMTINHTTFWGLAGILLAAAGALPPLSGWMESLDAGGKIFLCIFGAAALTGGVMASLYFSRLSMEKQESAIRFSLLSYENRQEPEDLDKDE